LPRTTSLSSCRILWIGILAFAAVVGCGSGSDRTSPAATEGNRYFGDRRDQEATNAAIDEGDCRVLLRTVEATETTQAHADSEASPPSSHCLISGRGLQVSVYLDASTAARQRYFNRMTEQVQFYGTVPAKRPHAVAGVGDRGAYNQSASWIPAFSTLYAVRGNRWLTVSYAAAGIPKAVREARAAELARQAFELTAR
jgi:hypothetical protein